MLDQLLEYGKQTLNKIVKDGIKSILKNPYVIGGIAVGCVAFVLIAGLVGGELEVEAAENGMQSATGSSWEQFKRYVATKEGGGNDGTYYFVEDDGAGNPTIGHGLCLYISGNGHRTAFANYGIDTVQLVNDYLAGKTAKVEMNTCDQIWEEDVLKPLFDSITSSYTNLTEYQCYALTDVKYRRGNTNGFQNEYDTKWTSSDDQYGNYNEANEPFSTDTLYNFFWNGGHSLPGVRTRKQDQWVLFKYGYYRPLKEYWKENAVFSGDLYNDDGSVNEEKMEEHRSSLEAYFGLPTGKVSIMWQDVSVSGYTPTKEANSLNTMGGAAWNYQCTWWANVRANYYLKSKGGSILPNRSYGNGKEVATTLTQYFNSGDTPKPNSVFSMTNCGGGYGHVAYVEAVDTVNGYYYVSHCGSGDYWHGINKVKIGNVPCGTLTDAGYIYLDSPKQ